MDVRMREVPAQVVVTEQRMVDQQSLERWLPEAMARVRKTAGGMAAGTAEQPYLLRGHVGGEPVFIVIYEGNPNEGETAVECCIPLHADGAAPEAGALGSRSRPQARRSTQRGLPARGRTALRAGRPADLRCRHPVPADETVGSNDPDHLWRKMRLTPAITAVAITQPNMIMNQV